MIDEIKLSELIERIEEGYFDKGECETKVSGKIKMNEGEFIELVTMMEQQGFCIMRETPMCEGDCINCINKKMLDIIDCDY